MHGHLWLTLQSHRHLSATCHLLRRLPWNGGARLLARLRERRGEDHIEITTDFAAALIPLLAILLQRTPHDAVKARIDSRHLLRGHLEHPTRQIAREHLVKHHAHRIQIRSSIHLDAEDERFGSHIVRRAHRHARLREATGVTVIPCHLGQAKVRHLHAAIAVDQHVGWFDVTVNDALLVRIAQRIANMRRDGQRMLCGQLAVGGDHLVHIGSIDVLHDKVELAVIRAAKVIHAHDGGMIQAAHELRLIFEALRKGRVLLLDDRRQQFDRHRAFEAQLDAAIHRAHAAAPHQLLHLILRQHALDLGRRGWFPAPVSAGGAQGVVSRRRHVSSGRMPSHPACDKGNATR